MKAMPNLPTSAWLLALLGMIGLAGCGRSASTVELQTGGGPKVDLGNGVMMELVPLRPGTFTMGEGRDAHQVTLTKPFWLGRTEATQAQWEALMGGNPSIIKDVGREAPVEHVSWEDAMQFCRKLTERQRQAGRLREGYEYTLPTEAQWEYACRAGTTTKFSWGEEFEPGQCNAGNFTGMNGNEKNVEAFRRRGLPVNSSMPVGRFQPNAWGLFDMSGNVREWCRDWYADYPHSSVTDPTGPSSGSYRILRGGGWFGSVHGCASADRAAGGPVDRDDIDSGFRLALSPVAAKPEATQTQGMTQVRSTGVSSRGVIGVEAHFTQFGDYLQELIGIVQLQWEQALGSNGVRPRPNTHVRISLRLNSQGEIAEIIKAEGDSGDYGMSVALTALKEHAPYRAWTKEMVAILGADQEVTFTFYYW